MYLSQQIKDAIKTEYDAWFTPQYGDKTKKERQKLGQFFTPPELSIRMIEKFDSITEKDILDPTVGAGGLLAAIILAGADPRRCYGIELDPDILKIAQCRLVKLGVPPSNLHLGNALESESYDFEPCTDKVYIVFAKTDKYLGITIVNETTILREKKYDLLLDKEQIKNLILCIKEKKVKAFKI